MRMARIAANSPTIDDRQGPAAVVAGWRSAIYFTAQERGNVRLYRQSMTRQAVATSTPSSSSAIAAPWVHFPSRNSGAIAYTFTSPRRFGGALSSKRQRILKQLTNLNADILGGKQIADVESFTFVSNDNKYEVEAFLVKPLGMTATSKHPLIVNIHGGPHGQNGPAFNFKDQIYAARGWAMLHVNYRGSTGYGQAFADAVFGDQNGNEAQDVLYGVSAALRRYLWLDRERMGIEGVSYGGQLDGLADHADAHVPRGDSHRRNFKSDQLQLHDLLQPVRADGIRPASASGRLDESDVGALGAEARGRRGDAHACSCTAKMIPTCRSPRPSNITSR